MMAKSVQSRGVQKRKAEAAKLAKELSAYSTVGIINFHKLPARQLFEIRSKLAGKAVIRMAKKSVIIRSLALAGLSNLQPYVHGEPALLLSKLSPLELATDIAASKSYAPAKPGDIPASDVWVRAGPTALPPGPAIGELQRAGLQVGVEGDKIVIRADKLFMPAGQPVKKEQADVAAKLGLRPIEIGLNLLAAWDGRIIFEQELLFKPASAWTDELKAGRRSALCLALAIAWPVPEVMAALLSKGTQAAIALATCAGWTTKETIGFLLARAAGHAKVISEQVGS